MTSPSVRFRPTIGVRLAFVGAVALITYFGWAIVWVLGAAAQGIKAVLTHRTHVPFLEQFGGYWQWVVASLAALVVLALLLASRHLLSIAIAWFLSFAILTVLGLIAFGPPDQLWAPLLPVGLAAVVLLGMRRLIERAT